MKKLITIFFIISSLISWAEPVEQYVQAKVTRVRGKSVTYALAGTNNYQVLKRGMMLPVGAHIKTGDRSEVFVLIKPGAAIRIAANSSLRLENMQITVDGDEITQRKAKVNLTNGTVSSMINKDLDTTATDFKVVTPQGVSAARGTFFAVTVHEGESYVKVKEGEVGVVSFEKDKAEEPDEF